MKRLLLALGLLALAACNRSAGPDGADVLHVGSQRGGTKAVLLASGALEGAPYKVEWSEFAAAQPLLEGDRRGRRGCRRGRRRSLRLRLSERQPGQGGGRAVCAADRPAGALALIVPASSPARSLADLKGLKIATSRGSVGHYLVIRALRQAKLPADWVSFTFLQPGDAKAAFSSGSIDGWATWAPYLAPAFKEGARTVVDGRNLVNAYGFDVANEKAIAAKRAQLADFLQREARALAWAKANPDAYAAVLSRETGLPLDVARDYAVKNARTAVPIDDAVIADVARVLDDFRASGAAAGQARSDRRLRTRFHHHEERRLGRHANGLSASGADRPGGNAAKLNWGPSMKTMFLTGAAALATAAFTQSVAAANTDIAAVANAGAAEAAAPDAPGDAGSVVVTGSRSRVVRTIADSPVPIDVITPPSYKATGRTGLKEVLGNIIPSLTMPALGGGGTSASVRPISIRGLSGDYLLVLVNGKRRHTTSLINNLSRISGGSTPVDIDLIPTNAVGRIEVLRDGAAAQYGSDAISGVINIILDNHPEGGEFTSTAGQLYEKGGELLQSTLGYGAPIGGDGGFVRVSVEGKYHDRADSSADPVPYVYPFVNGAPDPREAAADHLIAGGYGRSNRDKILNSALNAELPVGDGLKLYSFSTLSYRDIDDNRGAIVPRRSAMAGRPTRKGSPRCPASTPAGFQARRRIWEWDYQAALGLKGALGAWDFDVSSSYGRDHVKLGAVGTLNPSLGPASPTRFFMGKQVQDLWVNNVDLSRDYDIGVAQPLSVAVGVEHRWEKFQNIAGEPDSYRDGGYVIPADGTPFGDAYAGRSPSPGLVSFTGTSPADAASLSRNNIATYVDLSTSITGAWFVGVAGRFEHYDDSAGNTVSGKFSTRYEIAPGLAIRGGVNTGFRAPSLAQTGFSTTQNTVTVIGNDRVNTTSKFLPVNSVAALALGAKPLKPEKSLNYTAGFTFERGPARLTVDAYPDQGGRPHREDRVPRHGLQWRRRDPQHPDRQWRDGGGQRPVLHQRHRHAHARHRRGRRICAAHRRHRQFPPECRL